MFNEIVENLDLDLCRKKWDTKFLFFYSKDFIFTSISVKCISCTL